MYNPESDPNNWKWGFIYYNPSDSRLFVPKRIPAFGITFNFAHRYAYIVPIVIGVLFILAILK